MKNTVPVIVEHWSSEKIAIRGLHNFCCAWRADTSPVCSNELWVCFTNLAFGIWHYSNCIPTCIRKHLKSLTCFCYPHFWPSNKNWFHSCIHKSRSCLHCCFQTVFVALRVTNPIVPVHICSSSFKVKQDLIRPSKPQSSSSSMFNCNNCYRDLIQAHSDAFGYYPWLQNRPFEVRALGHCKWNGVSAEGRVWQVWEIATNTNINWLALRDG